MKGLSFITQIWRNPLDHMKPGPNGLFPLPSEIWGEILNIATTSDYESNDEDEEMSPNLFFSPETESLLRDPQGLRSLITFQTRLSIILVCKSWYFIGIEMLWNHVKLYEIDTRDSPSKISKVLIRNPALASKVSRLTILPCKTNTILNYSNINRQSLAKLIPSLKHLKMISCPAHVAPYINSIYASGSIIYFTKDTYYGFYFTTPCFWHQCRTLSIKYDQWYVPSGARPELVLSNLVNLRLRVDSTAAMGWVLASWKLPVLENLSIASDCVPEWIKLLLGVQNTLKSLQLPSHVHSYPDGGAVELKGLKQLHVVGLEDQCSMLYTTPFHRIISAPSLQTFVYYIDLKRDRRGLSYGVTSDIMLLKAAFPSVKEIILVSEEEWTYPYPYYGRNLAEFFSSWCSHGTSVEVITGRKDNQKRYTEDTILGEELTYRAVSDL